MAQSIYNLKKKKEKNAFQIPHKYSKEEYGEIRDNLKTNLQEIDQLFEEKNISSLKNRMIKMNVGMMEIGIDYYFNNETLRRSSYISDNFMQGGRQVFKSLRYIEFDPESGRKIQIMEKLHETITKLKSQEEYIGEIEEKIDHLRNANKIV